MMKDNRSNHYEFKAFVFQIHEMNKKPQLNEREISY